MSQNVVIKANGIHSNNNPYSAAPNGSMSEAVNVVIDKSEVVEPRRGFYQYSSTLADNAQQLINYKDRILAHIQDEILFDSNAGGTFTAFTGDAVDPVDSVMQIRSIEANGNLYFTSLEGIKKISARTASDFPTVDIEPAGMAKAVNLSGSTNYSSVGFLDPNSKVSYRLVFGRNDLNENLLLGAPSPILTIYNVSATQSCITTLTFTLPSDVRENDFYQIYRTALSTEAVTLPLTEPSDPGDEMYLVLEDTITAANISAGSISVDDITPEDFRRSGALLYTNPVSGEGITQANEKPPFAKDICVYKGFTWLANTSTVQRLTINLLSVEDLISNTSTFTITDGTTSTVYTFRGANESYTLTYSATFDATTFFRAAPATARYFLIHSAKDERKYCVWFKRNATNDLEPSLSGYINIEVDITSGSITTSDQAIQAAIDAINDITDDFNMSLNTGTRTLTVACANNGDVSTIAGTTYTLGGMTWYQDGAGVGEDSATNKVFLPRVPTTGQNGPTTAQQLEQAAKSIVSVVTKQDPLVNAFYMSSFDDVPGQIMFEHKDTTGDAFWLNSNASSDTFNPTVPTSGATVISTNEVRPNRIYFSKFQQPDSFPLSNYLDVGAKDREIKRIVPLRDALFIIKEDGVYKLTGDTAIAGTNNFNLVEFDFSVQILAPNSVVVLNNQIYGLATQGVVTISDTIVSIISRPIENQIIQIVKSGTNYKSASFGVPYESDRSYLLFTVTNPRDTVATQAFRYNTFTNSWTKWTISKTCGIVNFADDKLYLGASDLPFIEKERKQLNRYDYADREYEVEIPALGVNIANKTIKLSSLANANVGNVFLQRQYLTISQLVRLLNKLDDDALVNDADYLSTINPGAGDNLRTKLTSLAAKLDSDSGVSFTDYATRIGNYSYSITGNTAASQTVITIGANNLYEGRYVTISGSNCTPSIDGTWEVIARSATSITIDAEVTAPGTAGTVSTDVNNFKDLQGCYNIITARLNADAGVAYNNYPTSSDYYDFESEILVKNMSTGEIVVPAALDYIFGEAYIFQKIESYIVYNPQFFGDPSMEKQVSEGTIMFENSNFSKATIAYASDKSPAFEEIEFDKAGVGTFGSFSFGGGTQMNFGGISAPIPLRTYIPRAKQRCRFISVKFKHSVALQGYAIYGISLKFRPYNTRVSR